jgi:hypothetical protein
VIEIESHTPIGSAPGRHPLSPSDAPFEHRLEGPAGAHRVHQGGGRGVDALGAGVLITERPNTINP